MGRGGRGKDEIRGHWRKRGSGVSNRTSLALRPRSGGRQDVRQLLSIIRDQLERSEQRELLRYGR